MGRCSTRLFVSWTGTKPAFLPGNRDSGQHLSFADLWELERRVDAVVPLQPDQRRVLQDNTQPAIFVFGHEPAFPFHRHLYDSLNKYEANRDAFWGLLEREAVIAYVCGHTHVFSTYQPAGSTVWQIDVGNAGNDSSFLDGQSFLSVTVTNAEVQFEVCRNHDGPFSCAPGWSQPLPIVFMDGFESGDLGRWLFGTAPD